MSRVGKMPVTVPAGVDVTIQEDQISVKGAGGTLALAQNALVKVVNNGGKLSFEPANESRDANAMSGTHAPVGEQHGGGCDQGLREEAESGGCGLQGPGPRRQAQPDGGLLAPRQHRHASWHHVATPTPTEIVIKGADRQRVGQIAAEIRAVRPPEPYKGKGIRYADEKITIKETKKK
jgi:large subunit ribosomal protein L6